MPISLYFLREKVSRGEKPESSTKRRMTPDFNTTMKRFMEEDRKKMNDKKNTRSAIQPKTFPVKKRKRQAKKAPKKLLKEILKHKEDEHVDECSMSEKNEDSSAKMSNIEKDSTSNKKATVSEKIKVSSEKKKKKKEEVKSYEHDDTIINHLIRHRSGIPTYNQATKFGTVQFNHAVSKIIKETDCLRTFL